jgi:hypothetical protein
LEKMERIRECEVGTCLSFCTMKSRRFSCYALRVELTGLLALIRSKDIRIILNIFTAYIYSFIGGIR